MVFKPFSNLARQSITKHLVSGTYAQSVVVSAQTHVPVLHSLHSAPAFKSNAFGNAGQKAPYGTLGNGGENVANYHAVQDVEDKKERYLFSGKILWSKATDQTVPIKELSQHKRSLSRSFSTAAIDGELNREELKALEGEDNAIEDGELLATTVEEATLEGQTDAASVADSAYTSIVDNELADLESRQQWDEIEKTFEQRLTDGIAPTTASFNHLLKAAIQKGAETDEIVLTRVLNIYADLVERKVVPDTTTYSTVLNYLISTAQERFRAAKEAEQFNGAFSFNGVVPTRQVVSGREVMGYAIKIFHSSIRDGQPDYSLEMYRSLLDGCALYGIHQEMVNVYTRMESAGIAPDYSTFMILLRAFAETGDVDSALEVYKEVSADPSKYVQDVSELDEMYTHMLNAYVVAGKLHSGLSYFKRVVRCGFVDSITLDRLICTMVSAFAKRGDHETAYTWFEKLASKEMSRISNISNALMEAVKAGNTPYEKKWCELLLSELMGASPNALEAEGSQAVEALSAYLAQLIKEDRFEDCREFWKTFSNLSKTKKMHLPATPMALYANYLVERKRSPVPVLYDFAKYYDYHNATAAQKETDAISLGGLIEALAKSRTLSPHNLISSAKVLSETGLRFGAPAAEAMLIAFEDPALLQENHSDMEFLLRFVAINLPAAGVSQDTVHRLENVLNAVIEAGKPLEGNTQEIINLFIGRLGRSLNRAIVDNWASFLDNAGAAVISVEQPATPASAVAPSFNLTVYNIKGSKVLIKAIESSVKNVDEVMQMFSKFRMGDMPLTTNVYPKMIARCMRDNRYDALYAVYNAAEQDYPLDSTNQQSREFWHGIYDAMIAAELTRKDSNAAKYYHQRLSQIGGVASANTYGLYVVALSDCADIHDEATEAVAIMERAKAENVQLSAFLYNAVIGKLAKARRIDDCLFYFAEMRAQNLRPTSVTYGTMINALCRVSDERFAEELFEEMEAQNNYKPRAAPYNSMMQYYATSKRDRAKVIQYYNRLLSRNIVPTKHTYKCLMDAYASLPPPDLEAAKAVMTEMTARGEKVATLHHATIIHALGCVLQDADGAREYFDKVVQDPEIEEDAVLYQALLESLVANHRVQDTPPLLQRMAGKGLSVTAYIANTLIHGWALAGELGRAREIYDAVGGKKEPSTYEAMVRAMLSLGDREGAKAVVGEVLARGYPAAVTGRIVELLRGGGEYEVQVTG